MFSPVESATTGPRAASVRRTSRDKRPILPGRRKAVVEVELRRRRSAAAYQGCRWPAAPAAWHTGRGRSPTRSTGVPTSTDSARRHIRDGCSSDQSDTCAHRIAASTQLLVECGHAGLLLLAEIANARVVLIAKRLRAHLVEDVHVTRRQTGDTTTRCRRATSPRTDPGRRRDCSAHQRRNGTQ